MIDDAHLHVILKHRIYSILRQNAVQRCILLVQLGAIIGSNASGNDPREDDVHNERYDQEFNDKHNCTSNAM